MNADQIKHMVQRFLGWKLPKDLNPDGGIVFNRVVNQGTEFEQTREPTGTNLFDAAQAEAMVRHIVQDIPTEKPRYIVHELTSHERSSFDQAKNTLNAGGLLSRALACSMVDIVDRFTAHPANSIAETPKEWPPRFKMVDMSPAQAATFLKNIAVLANSGDKWEAFEDICKSMIESAFNAGVAKQ